MKGSQACLVRKEACDNMKRSLTLYSIYVHLQETAEAHKKTKDRAA